MGRSLEVIADDCRLLSEGGKCLFGNAFRRIGLVGQRDEKDLQRTQCMPSSQRVRKGEGEADGERLEERGASGGERTERERKRIEKRRGEERRHERKGRKGGKKRRES